MIENQTAEKERLGGAIEGPKSCGKRGIDREERTSGRPWDAHELSVEILRYRSVIKGQIMEMKRLEGAIEGQTAVKERSGVLSARVAGQGMRMRYQMYRGNTEATCCGKRKIGRSEKVSDVILYADILSEK